MNKFIQLIKGELIRLYKYKVFHVSLILAVIWFLLLFFIDNDEVFIALLPMIIIIDTAVMSIIYTGATLFFEKTEFTASTLLVTPVTHGEIILSKTIAGIVQTIFSTGLVVLAFYLIKPFEINVFILLYMLIFSTCFHTLLGFIATYITKDFTSMLVVVMMYTIALMIPTVLAQLDIFFTGDIWHYILLLTPTQVSATLADAAFGASISIDFYISFVYLLIGSYLLYQFAVKPNFKSYVLKQGGI